MQKFTCRERVSNLLVIVSVRSKCLQYLYEMRVAVLLRNSNFPTYKYVLENCTGSPFYFGFRIIHYRLQSVVQCAVRSNVITIGHNQRFHFNTVDILLTENAKISGSQPV